MDPETSATPDPQSILPADPTLSAQSGNPDGSGTPVTGGWSPPAK